MEQAESEQTVVRRKKRIRQKNKPNYQRELEWIIEDLREGEKPSVLLHACCAPCSSHCLEYLSQHFSITVLFYNPNISPLEEYQKRAGELERFVAEFPAASGVDVVTADYDPQEYYSAVKGLESLPEGKERCFACYRLRLEHTARYAAEHGFDYFCTTLSVSPRKNAQKLNEIGFELSELYPVKLLPADFKKRGGSKRSIRLSEEYGLYRQDYCGCVFSKRDTQSDD